MPFYQNVFDSDFIGVLLLGDRQLSLNFRVRSNTNSAIEMVGWNLPPYNLTGKTTLTLNYSFDAGRTWTPLAIDVSATAASVSAVKVDEVISALNANATFNALYEASMATDQKTGFYVKIRSKRARGDWKTYISNSGAENIIRFNKKAGVAELPTYFARHVITSTHPDSVRMLVELDESSAIDQTVITEAGLDYTVVQDDWEMLQGRSGMFTFKKNTVDGSNRITEVIEFPAGAEEGDFARKIQYNYSGSNTNPSQVFEMPHTLESGDLITP